VVAERMFLRG